MLNYLLTPWCRIFFEELIVTQLVKQELAFFMEPKGSFPCSQKPGTGPYLEPAFSEKLLKVPKEFTNRTQRQKFQYRTR
jgi:hypothetical protein